MYDQKERTFKNYIFLLILHYAYKQGKPFEKSVRGKFETVLCVARALMSLK